MPNKSSEGFKIVTSKKKKNVVDCEQKIELGAENNNQRSQYLYHDEGIGSSSPTESEESLDTTEQKGQQNKKTKRKKKNNKNKKKRNDSTESDQDSEKPKFEIQTEDSNNTFTHRRRRKSSRGDDEGSEFATKSIRWAPELVLEPSRVRTSSTGSILVKHDVDWSPNSYVCDCGIEDCSCDETNNDNTPEWTSRSLHWKTRFLAMAQMKATELNCIENKVYYCDKQQHLKLGSGRTVYLGLSTEGREVALRKLKTKQLPQLKPSFVRKLLELRHPNLIRYDQFIILKNQTYVMQELVDYSLGRWIRDKSVCQPLEKVDVCRQLCNGIRYLHDQDICHGDLRPANILITPVGRLTIANFALAPMNTANKNKTIEKRIEEIRPSSPECWRALETIWEITSDFKKESDISPLGMVLFTILTDGQHPYGLTGRKETAQVAMKNLIAPRYCLNLLNMDPMAKEMIRHLLHRDPLQRPTIREVLKNPFFWTNTQKLDHIRHILTVPKSSAIDEKSARLLIPSCGHFGTLPKSLSNAHDADTGFEAIDLIAEAFIKNENEEVLSDVLKHLPILLTLTEKHAQNIDDDVEDSGSSAKIGEVEMEFDFEE